MDTKYEDYEEKTSSGNFVRRKLVGTAGDSPGSAHFDSGSELQLGSGV